METAMWDSGISRKQLLQNITLLSILKNVPERPSENILNSGIESTHHLTLERENEIVGNLAFLAATTDDILKVMAVCIEEDDSGEAITIRIASNTGDLSAVVNGFNRIGDVLEQAARRGNLKHDNKQNLLREIVKFDVFRILSRLRSTHAQKSTKTAGKAVLIPQLHAALNHSSVKCPNGMPKSTLKTLRETTKDLLVLSAKLEGLSRLDMETDDAQDILMEIVTKAHNLTMTTNLSQALSTSIILDPSLVKFLPEAFGKLGRYYSAASELVCAARDRKCRVFLTVRIEPCQIEIPPNFLALNGSASITEAVNGLFQSPNLSKKSKATLKRQLASSLSRSDYDFRQRMSGIIENGKVHAEIQLLFFYESHPRSLQPRVICSSKSACYLCNLFIGLHGQFRTPRTHGRLYEKWILPDWLEGIPATRRQRLSANVKQMNSAIEGKIKEVYKGTQKPFIHPNESVLVERAHWPSTSELPENSTVSSNSTATLRQESVIGQESPLKDDQSASVITRESVLTHSLDQAAQEILCGENRTEPSLSASVTSDPKPIMETAESSSSEAPPSNAASSVPSSHLLHLPSTTMNHQLTRGETFWKQLSNVDIPCRVNTTSIHVIVNSGTKEGKKKANSEESRWLQLKWLQWDERVPLSVDGAKVVRLSDLEVGQDLELKEVDVLYLYEAGDIVEIKNCTEGPEKAVAGSCSSAIGRPKVNISLRE